MRNKGHTHKLYGLGMCLVITASLILAGCGGGGVVATATKSIRSSLV